MIPEITPRLGFYIHHHGAGHMMRALSIAAAFAEAEIIFMGSGLHLFQTLIPEDISCVHLPADLPLQNETAAAHPPGFLHYAPLGISGIRSRMAMIANVFEQYAPMLLIVDVSVEITLFARLCSIPTIVMRQHGERSDTAHLAAYESASLLLAPFPVTMATPGEHPWVSAKTLFAGGFSRFTGSGKRDAADERSDHIAVLVGEGGSSIDTAFVLHLAAECPEFIFHVAGSLQPPGAQVIPNIKWHGKLENPEFLLRSCGLVIGNAGHNTVMEMADLNKRFICIPENRPFEEQLMKAALLERDGHAKVVLPHELYSINWKRELRLQLAGEPCWDGVTDPAALQVIRQAIAKQLALILPADHQPGYTFKQDAVSSAPG